VRNEKLLCHGKIFQEDVFQLFPEREREKKISAKKSDFSEFVDLFISLL